MINIGPFVELGLGSSRKNTRLLAEIIRVQISFLNNQEQNNGCCFFYDVSVLSYCDRSLSVVRRASCVNLLLKHLLL